MIVLNWNGWDDTIACLRALRSLSEVEEVWLIDNGSKLDRGLEASVTYPGLRLLYLPQNYGYAGGYARALGLVQDEGREFAYLLNNDTEPKPGFLRACLALAMNDESVGAVGSSIVDSESNAGADADEQARVIGAGMLVRIAAVRRCGAFDERFFCYGEEHEWCERIARAGFRSVVCRDSVVVHAGEKSDEGGNATYYRIRNRFLMASTRSAGRLPLPERLAIFHHVATVAVAARLEADRVRWEAAACGLEDACAGRFGPRSTTSPSTRARWRLHLLVFLARVADRLALAYGRGRPPSPGTP